MRFDLLETRDEDVTCYTRRFRTSDHNVIALEVADHSCTLGLRLTVHPPLPGGLVNESVNASRPVYWHIYLQERALI